MRVLLVHPSPLMYSELYLRLEPLGLERVAAAVEAAGHDVRLLDLQIFTRADYRPRWRTCAPQAVGFSLNYLANVPEVVDLATRDEGPARVPVVRRRPQRVVHRRRAPRRTRTARSTASCAARARASRRACSRPSPAARSSRRLPGVVTAERDRPAAAHGPDLGTHRRRAISAGGRHKYFIGELDPCASIEFTRGCPWDCCVLQRVDVLRAQLSQGLAGGGGRGPGAHPRAQRLHRGRRRLHPRRARLRDRRRDRAPADPQAVLPRDALRRAAPQPRGLRALEAARAPLHVPRHRGHRRRGAQAPPQARDARARTTRPSRSPARSASPSPSTSSPIPTGTSGASRWCASGR